MQFIEEISSTTELMRIEMADVDHITTNGAAEEGQEQHIADSDVVDTSEVEVISATDQKRDISGAIGAYI